MSPLKPSGTQSLERSFGLLKLVASAGPRGLRLADLIELTEMQRPTVARMVGALTRLQLLARVEGSPYYVLGDYCRELVAAYSMPSDLRSVCDSVLTAVSEETHNSAFLFVPAELDTLCVARRIGSYPIQVLSIKLGHRQPIGVGAGGMAMLSRLPAPDCDRILKSNEKRLASYGDLTVSTVRAVLRATRQRGYALMGHYSVPGVVGIGVPLCNAKGEVIGAITSASISSRMSREASQQAAECVIRHVEAVQARLDTLPAPSLTAASAR